MQRRIHRPLVLVSLLLLAGCAGFKNFPLESADMFVNQTVGPEYIEYVNADSRLTDEQKARRLQNVASFRGMIEQAKKSD